MATVWLLCGAASGATSETLREIAMISYEYCYVMSNIEA